MKKWLLLVPLLLGLSLFCSGQAVTTLDQNCNLWGAAPATPQCGGTTSAASGTQLFFPDIRGTITNQFEVVVQGTAPATLTVIVVGCMRGGTCGSTLASSSGTASQILTPASSNLNVYDKYGITVSWTGGDSTTRFVVNRTGTVAKLSGGTGASCGSPNCTIPGVISSYNGVATVSGGVGSFVAKADATAQGAAITATTLYAVPASGAGFYRFTCYVVLTQAATTSSTLPSCDVNWTDNDTNVAIAALPVTDNNHTQNTVGTVGMQAASALYGQAVINVKASTNIQYSTVNYISSGATPMQYAVHTKLEFIGN